MRRIELPNGGWAEVREQADVRVKHKHLLRAALTGASTAMRKLPTDLPQLPDDPVERAAFLQTIDLNALTANGVLNFDDVMALQRVEEIAVAVFTVAWSLKVPPPTVDTVGDMEENVYEAIAAATRKDAAAVMRGVDFDPTPEDKPGSPTGPPNDSNGYSRDEGGVPSIKQWQTASASTSSGG
jgi:hypothetical protein